LQYLRILFFFEATLSEASLMWQPPNAYNIKFYLVYRNITWT